MFVFFHSKSSQKLAPPWQDRHTNISNKHFRRLEENGTTTIKKMLKQESRNQSHGSPTPNSDILSFNHSPVIQSYVAFCKLLNFSGVLTVRAKANPKLEKVGPPQNAIFLLPWQDVATKVSVEDHAGESLTEIINVLSASLKLSESCTSESSNLCKLGAGPTTWFRAEVRLCSLQ